MIIDGEGVSLSRGSVTEERDPPKIIFDIILDIPNE